jgi:ATP-dependent protease ClpP protease subunit
LDWNIRRRGNHIYFYEEINEVTQMILEVMLRDAVRDVLTSHVGEILGGELSESVVIHVNSPGGYLSCGFALYDYIKTSQIPITCLVEGLCASAATLVMLACHNRIMSPNSVFLMHQCSWGAWGENRFMQDLSVNADKAMKRLRKIYMEETKIGEDHPDNRESYIQHLLEHDYELSAEECEAFGITTPSDDDDEVELSDERVELLQNYVKKLAAEQKKENAKKEAEEKEGGKKKAPAKKAAPKATPKKKPAKKDETETKSE